MTCNRNFAFSDKKTAYILSASLLVLLLLAFIIPQVSGRIVGAVVLLPATAITSIFLKKRSILSINTRTVLMIMSVMGLLYLTLYYMTGIVYGLYYAAVRLSVSSLFKYILPITAIIIASEIIRSILLAQASKGLSVLAYFICFIAEVLITSNLWGIRTFNQFSDVLGQAFFPAVTANILYHYLSKRYGVYPNIVYRLIITLFPYIIPYTSQLSPALYSFARLVIPLIIYNFIDALYEPKRRYALQKKSKWSAVITAITLVLMILFVMLISCQFKYGMVVIATESMTGEINKGDAIIYTRYDDQTIEEGQVIVFKKNKNMIVHRVVDIQNINGVTRYYTKGDANNDMDAGYITDAEIFGLTDLKVAYIGVPTVWLREMFS